jgi:ribosomal-protein-alanine N-acetyltransferase
MTNIRLETPRLIIRPLSEEYLDDWFEMDSDPEVRKYIDQSPNQSKEEIREVLKMIQQQYLDNGIGRWAVLDKETGEMVGWCGLKLFKEPLNGLVNIYELGYRFKQKHWGKGLATESSTAILNWGFENLGVDKFYAITDPENKGSRHVLEKLGFEFKEIFQFELFDKVDCTFYVLNKANWK